jgi:shikimate dehydrogenase
VAFAALFLVGDPADHSLSPEMQAAALAWAGLRGAYLPFRAAPRDLAATLRALDRLGFRGGNVTIPHKERALRLMGVASARARAIGAANVIARGPRGFAGDNTDGAGFVDALRARAGLGVRGRRVLLLGAGGAARAVLHAAVAGGAREVVVLNRTPSRARRLARAARAWGGATAVAHGPLGDAARAAATAPPPAGRGARAAARFDIVVNATAHGLRGEPDLIVPRPLLRGAAAVVDLVYAEDPTRLAREARACGVRLVDGLDILAGQGRLSFARWFGIAPPWRVMLSEARAAWARRRSARR